MGAPTRTKQEAADRKLETGIQQNLTTPLTVGGKQYTAAQIATVLQARIDARSATDVAKAAYAKAVAAEAAQMAGSKGLLVGVKAVLLAMFAGAPDVLTAMGLSERKTPVKSVAVKSEAITKSAATRLARHTTGPKAKAKITGAVPVVAGPPAVTPGGVGHT